MRPQRREAATFSSIADGEAATTGSVPPHVATPATAKPAKPAKTGKLSKPTEPSAKKPRSIEFEEWSTLQTVLRAGDGHVHTLYSSGMLGFWFYIKQLDVNLMR